MVKLSKSYWQFSYKEVGYYNSGEFKQMLMAKNEWGCRSLHKTLETTGGAWQQEKVKQQCLRSKPRG